MKWTKEDTEIIFQIAESMTGSCQKGSFRKEILVSNVKRRMEHLQVENLKEYFDIALTDNSEKKELLSALTIHTTSWFREMPHFNVLNEYLEKLKNRDFKSHPFKVWSAACSSGEEIYSISLILERWKMLYPDFEYQLWASDIDPKSVNNTKKALYSLSQINAIPKDYWPWLLIGKDEFKNKFTVCKSIRERMNAFTFNLTDSNLAPVTDFDVIFCRNVLIYFDSGTVIRVLDKLITHLISHGLLILGHSEAMAGNHRQLKNLKSSSFIKKDLTHTSLTLSEKKLRILIIDDVHSIRKSISKIVNDVGAEAIESESLEEAQFLLSKTNFDLITLDLNPRGRAGMVWLEERRKEGLKIPVVVVSDAAPGDATKVFGALELGAEEYFSKSNLDSKNEDFKNYLKALVDRNYEKRGPRKERRLKVFNFSRFKPEVILIGASTGGPDAIWGLLKNFPKNSTPPIVIVQHISSEFMKAFAERVAMVSGLKLVAQSNESLLRQNHIYFPVKESHMVIKKNSKGELLAAYEGSEKYQGHCPSVSRLFQSAAKLKIQGVAILLTGMGADGADGLKELADTEKFYTIAQDQDSCIVYGMPKVARDLGAVCFTGNLHEIREDIELRLHLKGTVAA